MEIKGQITLLFNHDGLRIEVTDKEASVRFLDIELNQKQTCQALSRLGNTPCEIRVQGLDRIGKKHECKIFEFELGNVEWLKEKESAIKKVKKLCPEGWVPDLYFSSQSSFFTKDGKKCARTFIRRWV